MDAAHSARHALPESFSCGDVDGIIAVADHHLPQALERLRQDAPTLHCPIITLLMPQPDCSSVVLDFQAGAYAAAAHLLDLGHRHLLHFYSEDPRREAIIDNPKMKCLYGYCQACRDRGLDAAAHLHYTELDPRLHRIAFDAMSHPKLAALSAFARWARSHPLLRELRRHPEITALLAPNDPAAIVFRDILRQGSYRVPEDISLVGFDDSNPLLDKRGQNMLTTVRVPLRQLGRKAARLVISRVTDPLKHDTQLLLEPTLVVRGSTAPPRAR